VITALDEQLADKYHVSIYPNPTAGILHIVSDESLHLAIFDLTGKQVLKGEKQGGAAEMNIGDLQTGLFILVLHDDQGSKMTYKVEVIR